MLNKIIKEIIRKRLLHKIRQHRLKTDCPNTELPELTASEKEQILKVWGQVTSKINFDQHRLFKKINGHIDAKLLTDDVFVPYVERSLNPYKHMWFASNKSMYPIWYKDLKQPVTYIRKVNDNVFFLDKQCDIRLCIDQLCELDIDGIIIKQSIDSYGGFSVKKVSLSDFPTKELKKQHIYELLLKVQGDFVIQEIVKQSKDTSFLNDKSLNTIRATSLNINNRTTVCYAQFRSGINGSVVDNLSSGGGIMTSIDSDGKIGEYGINRNHDKVQLDSTKQSHYLKSYKKIVSLVEKYHSLLFPNFGIIGWDWAIDENEEPVFIGANLWYPGVYSEQLIAGQSVFGDRTQEVIDYVIENRAIIYTINI